MIEMPKAGDTVLFHFDSSNTRRVREAKVLYVWLPHEAPKELELLCLEVDFQQEDFDDGSVPTRLQSHCPRGTGAPIQSGAWTLPSL